MRGEEGGRWRGKKRRGEEWGGRRRRRGRQRRRRKRGRGEEEEKEEDRNVHKSYRKRNLAPTQELSDSKFVFKIQKSPHPSSHTHHTHTHA